MYTVDADRVVCTDGPTATTGAAFAQTDPTLYLLHTRFDVALADVVGHVLLIDGRHAQAPFVLSIVLASGNALITRLVARIEAASPNLPSTQALVDELAISQHTLSRHVREAAGRSTLALVQSMRPNRTCTLIRSSCMTTDSVAEAVGYEDATALRRLMHKVSGVSPSQYRSAT